MVAPALATVQLKVAGTKQVTGRHGSPAVGVVWLWAETAPTALLLPVAARLSSNASRMR